jgi:hypothetical protein
MCPNEHNPLGFWESDAFFAYHERLLRDAGTDWDEWTPVAVDGLAPTTLAQLTNEWRDVWRHEFGDAPLCAVKDPRICRLVPFWLRNLVAHGIEPSAVIVVRSPVEVTRSLAVRDGLGEEHALLLWLRHMLDAEKETRSISRSFVSFQDLLRGWEPTARRIFQTSGLDWPDPPEPIGAEIAAFLRSDLRHHVVGLEGLSVPAPLHGWVKETDAAFARLLTGDPESARDARAVLDGVRDDVDRFGTAFGPVFKDMRRAVRQRTADLELELRRHVAQLEAESGQRRQQALAAEAERDQNRQQALAAEADRDRLRDCVSRLEGELEQLRPHASRVEQERDRLVQDLAQSQLDGQRMIGALSQRLAASEIHAQALMQSRSWRWTAPLRAAFRVYLRMRDATG